jgi:hypothetical protein
MNGRKGELLDPAGVWEMVGARVRRGPPFQGEFVFWSLPRGEAG